MKRLGQTTITTVTTSVVGSNCSNRTRTEQMDGLDK